MAKSPGATMADRLSRAGSNLSNPMSKTVANAAAHLNHLDHFDVLEYCLGFDKPGFPKMLEDCVLVSLCVEHNTMRPSLWSEVGFSILHRNEARNHTATPGDHSENLMKCATYRHIRIEENMRFLNLWKYPTDPHNHRNHFGETRFTSEQEAKDVLQDTLSSRPVILLTFPGLCNHQDLPRYLQLPPNAFDCVVATISTQRIARERGIDWNVDKPKDFTGICESLGFRCADLSSASNYAAFNMVAVIQMAMCSRIKLSMIPLQTKVNELQIESQCRNVPWGHKQFCFQCGSNDHDAFNVHGRPTCDMDWEVECARCWTVNEAVDHADCMCPYG